MPGTPDVGVNLEPSANDKGRGRRRPPIAGERCDARLDLVGQPQTVGGYALHLNMGLISSQCCDDFEAECCVHRAPPEPPKDPRLCTVNCFEWFAVSLEPPHR